MAGRLPVAVQSRLSAKSTKKAPLALMVFKQDGCQAGFPLLGGVSQMIPCAMVSGHVFHAEQPLPTRASKHDAKSR